MAFVAAEVGRAPRISPSSRTTRSVKNWTALARESRGFAGLVSGLGVASPMVMHQATPRHAVPSRCSARRFRRVSLALGVFGAVLAGQSVKAQSIDATTPSEELGDPSPGHAWETRPMTPDASYGAEIVLTDLSVVAAGALWFAATNQSEHSNSMALIDALAWSFASPVVHAVHGRPGRGAASLLLHAGLPILGALVGRATINCPAVREDSDPDALCGAVNVGLGFGLGMVSATILDAAILAQIHDDTASTVATRGGGATSAPSLAVNRDGGLSFGWRGTF